MFRRHLQIALLLGSSTIVVAHADPPDDAVHWTVSVVSAAAISHGGSATLEVSGVVQDGWHVYALEQQARGPTPLRISLDANSIAIVAGPVSGTAAQIVHDAHFGFDVELYTHPFVIDLPVKVLGIAAAGSLLIPVSVRFQACSDRECLLPLTVHLSARIDVAPRSVVSPAPEPHDR